MPLLDTDALVVVVAGRYRSGSTWLYNAVRLALRHANHTVWGGGTQAYATLPAAQAQPYSAFVIKEHKYHPLLADAAHYVFHSQRRWEDAVASYERFKQRHVSRRELRQWMQWEKQWLRHASYTMPFAVLEAPGGQRAILSDVAQVLDLELGRDAMERVHDDLQRAMQPPRTGKHPVTLVFHNHYTRA